MIPKRYKNKELKRITLELLSISNFRNCESLNIQLDKGFNVITGLNGAGKTTILDSIYYLTNGRSYFTNQDKFLYKEGTDFFRIVGNINNEDSIIQCQISSSASSSKKIKVDDKVMKSISEYYGRYPSFMIAPKDIQILVESSVERRRLINKTLSQVDKTYLLYLLRYNKLLKQRNALLKSFQKGQAVNQLLVSALNNKMVEPAEYIHNKRKTYVEKITPIFNQYYNEISDEREKLSIAYHSNLTDKSIDNLFENSFSKDLVLAKTTEGIHKDDIILKINEKDIKKYASQGQLKSAIISLKLSQIDWVKAETGLIPILLMDDIFDKLDSERVEKLLEICENQLKSQIFITDTELGRIKFKLEKLNIHYKHFNIAEGNIES